jgi:hypothetical protein
MIERRGDVLIAVEDQRGHAKLAQLRAEVGLDAGAIGSGK